MNILRCACGLCGHYGQFFILLIYFYKSLSFLLTFISIEKNVRFVRNPYKYWVFLSAKCPLFVRILSAKYPLLFLPAQFMHLRNAVCGLFEDFLRTFYGHFQKKPVLFNANGYSNISIGKKISHIFRILIRYMSKSCI